MLHIDEKVATLHRLMQDSTKYKSIVLMGKIASGKGTQARLILEHYGGCCIQTETKYERQPNYQLLLACE